MSLGRLENKWTSMKDEEWEVLDKKELCTIQLCLGVSISFNISIEKKTSNMMKELDKIYEKPLASNKVFYKKHLLNMKMSKGGSIANHLNDFNMVTNQLSSVGVNTDDEVRDSLILCSFLERWNGLVMDVSNYVFGSRTLKFYDVVSVTLSQEMRQKRTCETSGNSLTIENRGRKREREKNPRNHGKFGKGKYKSRQRVECWNNGKKIHLNNYC